MLRYHVYSTVKEVYAQTDCGTKAPCPPLHTYSCGYVEVE